MKERDFCLYQFMKCLLIFFSELHVTRHCFSKNSINVYTCQTIKQLTKRKINRQKKNKILIRRQTQGVQSCQKQIYSLCIFSPSSQQFIFGLIFIIKTNGYWHYTQYPFVPRLVIQGLFHTTWSMLHTRVHKLFIVLQPDLP